jgi:hypothetical protein
MTDRELAAMGERLYEAIIETPLSPLEIGGLTAAFRTRTPWAELGSGLKVALFRIAANAASPVATQPTPDEAATEEPPAAAPSDDGTERKEDDDA